MLNIDSIENGIVIDHITAGLGMRIYELLELDKKNLEYQYKLGQLADADFLSQYAALLEEKQGLKEQRELLDAQLKLYNELLGPGALGPKGPLGP